jgi:hypothetical protein
MRNNGSNLDVASISKSLEESNLPLQDCLDDKSIWFLTLSGLYWRKKPYYLPILWSIVVLLIVFLFYLEYGLLGVVLVGIHYGGFNFILLFELGITFQGIATIFIVVHTHGRMHQIVNKLDLFVFPESRRVTLICVFVFFATYFSCFITGWFHLLPTQNSLDVLEGPLAFLGLLASSAFLSVNLLFLIVDAKVSMSLLTSLTEQDSVTVEEYNRVKAEIDNRVSKSRTSNNIVMGMALTNVIIVFLVFIISEQVFSNAEFILTLISGMSREVIYAVIGFWFVALVNEKSHELTKKLSKRV